MSEPLLIKRLHVSGLTPSITPADLDRRLSSFGKVKIMDGFGARDALGDPRKFGFVTMEIGTKELAKCLNVLSGSVWKGAKLRIGEAKPDFRERLAQFNSLPLRPDRPKRTRVGNCGYPSSAHPLKPLSATAAASTPGWIVTPSGRVVRPMRMRPERPLEPMHSELGTSKTKGLNNKVKKRVKPPIVRARRRLIDPTKWDSVYLKGVFLDAVPIPSPPKDALEPPARAKHNVVDEEEEECEEDSTDSNAFYSASRTQVRASQPVSQLPSPQREAAFATSSRVYEATESIDVRSETSAALAMLGEMFGDKEDWEGRESVDEMEVLEDNESGRAIQVDEEDGVQVVPRDFREGGRNKISERERKGKGKAFGEFVCSSREDEMGAEAAPDRDAEMEEITPPVSIKVLVPTADPPTATDLRALFAPREDASFSLLDHLDVDLDLELGADILGINAPPCASQENGRLSQPVLPEPSVVQIRAAIPATKVRSQVALDPSLPMLFPSPDSLPHPYTHSSDPMTTIHQHGIPPCILFPSTTRLRGLRHLPQSSAFTRSSEDTPESIRERWERDKVPLTREWKRAWREARGGRKRGTGAGGEVGGGY